MKLQKNTKLYLIIAAALVLIAALWYFFLRKSTTAPEIEILGSGSSATPAKSDTLSLPKSSYPLAKGSTGTQVLYFQAYLNKYENENLTLDGIWGSLTQAAFDRYKSKSGNLGIFSLKFESGISESMYNSGIRPYESELKKYINSKGINF